MATKGYTVPEVEAAYVRAHELCLQIGDTLQLFPVLWGLWAFYHVQARYQTARELGERCLSLAQGAQDPVFLLGAHYALGQTAFWLGEPVSARAHIERCVALDHVRYHASYRHLYGFDIGAVGQCYVPWTLWLLGHADQALTKMHEALTLIQERSQHYILAWALDFIATLHQFRRENHASRERAEAAITLSNEQGYPYWLGVGTILRGWALAEQGQGEEGVRQIRQGISTYQATGAELNRPYFLPCWPRRMEK